MAKRDSKLPKDYVTDKARCFFCGESLYIWQLLWQLSPDLAYQVPMCLDCAAKLAVSKAKSGGKRHEQ